MMSEKRSLVSINTLSREKILQLIKRAEEFEKNFYKHLVPYWSNYYTSANGKWFYHLANAEECTPYPLPENAVRHGRSWCEF